MDPGPSARHKTALPADAMRSQVFLFQTLFTEKGTVDHDTSRVLPLHNALRHLQRHSVSMYLMSTAKNVTGQSKLVYDRRVNSGPAISSNYALFCSGSEVVLSKTKRALEPKAQMRMLDAVPLEQRHEFSWRFKDVDTGYYKWLQTVDSRPYKRKPTLPALGVKYAASCFDDDEYLPRPMAAFVTVHYMR